MFKKYVNISEIYIFSDQKKQETFIFKSYAK